MIKSSVPLLAGIALMLTQTSAAEAPLAALHLQNNAGQSVQSYLGAFEDSLTSHFSGEGLRIVSADTALGTYSGAPDDSPNVLDSSSLQRVAQTLGADFALSATITSYNTTKKSFDTYGVKGTNLTHTLRLSYKLLDASDGGTVIADTIAATKTIRQGEGLTVDDSEALASLLDDAATQLATAFAAKSQKTDLQAIAAKPAAQEVTFTLAIKSQTIPIPSVIAREDGTYEVKPSTFTVEPAEFTVELDGVTIGSAGSKTDFTALPGIHRLTIGREGYQNWSRTVNIRDGFSLSVEAAQTPAELERMKSLISYFQGLSDKTTLTAAEAEEVKGKAQALRQSGYRIDTQVKSDSVEETNLNIGDTPQTFDLLRDIFAE